MQELMRCAQLASKSAIKPLWFLIAIAVLFEPDAALTQAGSTGGNVGKQDKSVSGVQDDESAKPHRAQKASPKPSSSDDESAKPHRAQKASPKPSRSAPVRAETGTPAASGAWTGVSTGGCIPNWRWTLQISGEGIITGSGATGHVGRGGAGNGIMRVFGKNYYFVGHFGPSTGSGTWKRDDGCSGSWTGTKS